MNESGVFADFNFKLVVVEALLDKKPLFAEELRTLANQYSNDFEWYSGNGPIVEIMEYLEKLTLVMSDLDKIDNLCFDGGNEIYHILKPDWDGEDSLFDIVSVEGFQSLKNLETVNYFSMCNPKILEPFKQAGIIVRD